MAGGDGAVGRGRRPAAGIGAWVLAWLLASGASLPVHAAEYLIREIRFEGNERTRPQTMLQEFTFEVGERATDEDIERSRQAVMDLGLFKAVKADLDAVEGGHRLTMSVNEKHYLLGLPKLSRNGDGDISYGALLRLDNLGGRNQRLDMSVRRKELKDSDVDQEDQLEIEYTYPRIWGSPYQLELDIDLEQAEIDEERGTLSGQYERRLDLLRATISRWLRQRGPSKGWLLGASLQWEDYEHEFLGGDPGLFFDADVRSLVGFIEYRDVHDYLYSNEGQEYGYQLQVASDAFGSEASFTRHFLFYRGYRLVTRREHTNFNYQLRMSTCNRSIFGDPCFSIGGSTAVRGFDRESIEGDAYFIFNSEFMTPIGRHKSWRAVAFLDVGTIGEDVGDLGEEVKVGTGFGVRWRIESFVRTDLRLDFAQGLDDGESKVYASTSATF